MERLKQLAKDAYFKTSNFSEGQADDYIRKEILDMIGEPLPEKKADLGYWMEDHGKQVFRIITQIVTPIHNDLLLQKFPAELVDLRVFDLGDKEEYVVENQDLFPVAIKATGHDKTSRSRIYDRKVDTSKFEVSTGAYIEVIDFLLGKISWTRICDKIIKSIDNAIALAVSNALFTGYEPSSNPNMCEQTTEALLEEKLDDKIEKVEGATGYPAMIVGTKHALAKIENQGTVVLSDTEERKRTGLIGMYKHCSLVELPNVYHPDSNVFDVARDYILILPVAGEGLVKLGYEGNELRIA